MEPGKENKTWVGEAYREPPIRLSSIELARLPLLKSFAPRVQWIRNRVHIIYTPVDLAYVRTYIHISRAYPPTRSLVACTSIYYYYHVTSLFARARALCTVCPRARACVRVSFIYASHGARRARVRLAYRIYLLPACVLADIFLSLGRGSRAPLRGRRERESEFFRDFFLRSSEGDFVGVVGYRRRRRSCSVICLRYVRWHCSVSRQFDCVRSQLSLNRAEEYFFVNW